MKEFLLAESGSTKTHWIHFKNGKELSFVGTGLNPNHHTDSEFLKKISSEIPIRGITGPVYFFGAGCATDNQQQRVEKLLKNHFKTEVTVKSDLDGACIATSGTTASMVAILGTGTSTCRWDGEKIIQQAPSLGYLLGDEGSGASFGKYLVIAFLRNEMPEDLRKKFAQKFETTHLISSIYGHQQQAALLASYFTFVTENRSHTYITALIQDQVAKFVKHHIIPLAPTTDELVHFCGSVAVLLKEELGSELEKHDLYTGNFVQQPVYSLLEFYKNQNF